MKTSYRKKFGPNKVSTSTIVLDPESTRSGPKNLWSVTDRGPVGGFLTDERPVYTWNYADSPMYTPTRFRKTNYVSQWLNVEPKVTVIQILRYRKICHETDSIYEHLVSIVSLLDSYRVNLNIKL